jgi:hypothetical protein
MATFGLQFLTRVFFIFGLISPAFAGETLSEDQKIERLFKTIESSDVVFIRNGEEHNSYEAADHLRKKLKAAQSSFFAPEKTKWTARMFINKVASQSSMSGRPYQINLGGGQVVDAKDWLLEKLLKRRKNDVY